MGKTIATCLRLAQIGFALLAISVLPAAAGGYLPQPLTSRAGPFLSQIFPGADHLGAEAGAPASAAAYSGDRLLGFVFSTFDVVHAPGYSGVPFDVIAGVGLDGRVTGAKVVYQVEPHIAGDPKRQGRLDDFLAAQAGVLVRSTDRADPQPNFVSGATVSARAMREAIIDSAREVLRSRLGRPSVTAPTLDVDGFEPASFAELLAQGSVVTKRVTNGEVAAAFGAAGWTAEVPPDADPGGVYIDLTAALLTPAAIGRNLLGQDGFAAVIKRLPEGSQTLLLGATGTYDLLGSAYRFAATNFRFDRFRLVQGDRTFVFDIGQFRRTGYQGASPGLAAYLFTLKPDSGFDPLKPWRVDLLINGTDKVGKPVSVPVEANYTLPAMHILMPDPVPVPAYVEAWQEARGNVFILGAALGVLTLILIFQNELTKRRRLFRVVRNSFLVFTLGWLGWTAGAQLSTLHLVNYLGAPFRGFDVGFYLTEPLIVIIAGYTLVSLIMLGRGVFCGWLCPFGALQELLAQVAKALRLPQWSPPDWLNRKLWLVKYAVAALVIVLGFLSPDSASKASEVEPFKTAITSMFTRPWPYEIYAGFLLAIGLFTERAYCRFLCPLGGTLAFLDRLHLVDVLKRRPECGTPCQLCSHSCPVKAIVPSGEIKMAECFQCLDCQVEYNDDHRCPPLVRARKHGLRGNTIFTTPKARPVAVPVAARTAE